MASNEQLLLSKDIVVPSRQNFSVKVDFFPFSRAPPSITSFRKSSEWVACRSCGEPTLAIRTPFTYLTPAVPPHPEHILCAHDAQRQSMNWTPRSGLNRHDRKRRGLPRPPRPPADDDYGEYENLRGDPGDR